MSRSKNKEPKVEAFRLALSDSQTHKRLWSLSFTRAGFLVIVLSTVLVGVALVFSLIAFTPVRNIIPGYPDAHATRAAVQNAIKIDSLERVITRWELYSDNLVRILEGADPMPLDSVIAIADREEAERDEAFLASRDSLLRAQVDDAGQFDISGAQKRDLPPEGLHFFTPLHGVVSKEYDPVLHPYIDVAAAANSVVMSTLGGTVVFAGWNDESGYTVAVQHSGELISIYKHNTMLLRKVGDRVFAGTPIALVGGDKFDHLHFELWYKGETLNPRDHISF